MGFKLFFFLFISWPFLGKAYFLFEPYMGVEHGDFKESEHKGTFENQTQGFRLGYTGDIFTFGTDTSFGDASYDATFLSDSTQRQYDMIDLGFFFGLKWSQFRVYYAYMASYLRKKNNNDVKRTYYGDTYKIALSYNFFWKFALNAENIRRIFDEYEEDRKPTLKISPFDLDGTLFSISLVFKI